MAEAGFLQSYSSGGEHKICVFVERRGKETCCRGNYLRYWALRLFLLYNESLGALCGWLELERAVTSDRDEACGTLMLNHCQGDISELRSEAIGSRILLSNRYGVNAWLISQFCLRLGLFSPAIQSNNTIVLEPALGERFQPRAFTTQRAELDSKTR